MTRYVFAAFSFLLLSPLSHGKDWPRFLGPTGNSVSTESEAPPMKWSDTENLKWKLELPGRGVSCPIVVGEKVFVTCYSGYGTGGQDEKMADLKRHLVCVSRTDGKVIWQKNINAELPEDPYSGMGVPAHGYASHTPVSDGKHVFAFFGKTGVIAFDIDGNELWRKSVGKGSGSKRWGSSASPILYKDSVIVTAADESEAIFAFDKTTGKELWKCNGQFEDTYNTPVLVKVGDRTDLAISVPGEVWGINPDTGKLRWYSRGVTDNTAAASLALGDGIVYATGGRGGDAVAVKAGGKGDVNDSHVVWDANIPGRFATPVFYDGHLYCFSSSVLTCYDAETGDRVKQQRLGDGGGAGRGGGGFGGPGGGGRGGGRGGRGGGGPGGDYASPVLADGKLFVTASNGTFYIVEANPEMKLISTNKISDTTGFAGSPAFSNGEIFLRSHGNLYCIANLTK